MISFVVPAHDEAANIVATIASIRAAVGARAHEVIVVADACSDDTARLAGEAGARVLEVDVRQIAAARNAGAAAAKGDVLVFVDADTRIDAAVVQGLERALADGAVGGGALVRFDRPVPWWAHALVPLMTAAYFAMRLAAGCFVFATREAFAAVGGFDKELFAAEEVEFSRALKRYAKVVRFADGRRGRFVVLRERVETSARKLRTHSGWQLLGEVLRLLLRGRRGVRDRKALSLWYGPRQHDPGART